MFFFLEIRTMRRIEARSKESYDLKDAAEQVPHHSNQLHTIPTTQQQQQQHSTHHSIANRNQKPKKNPSKGLIAPMQAYVSAPRLTINVVRRTTTYWDTLLKLWQVTIMLLFCLCFVFCLCVCHFSGCCLLLLCCVLMLIYVFFFVFF
jgi:fatty-acid desaturase